MAATLQGNEVVYAAVKQTAPDAGVPTNPAFTILRRTDGDIDRNATFTQSNETDPTRQAPQQVLTQFAIEGSQDGEFPLADPGLRLMLESALQNTFAADLAINANTISFDNGSSEIRDSGNGFTNVVAGSYIGVFNTGSQTESVFYVTSKADNGTLVVAPAPVTEAAGATVDIRGQNIRNGKNEQALTIQKRLPAVSETEYRTFQGCQVNTLSITLTASALLTTSIGIIGLDQRAGTGIVPGQTDVTQSTARVIGSVSGVPSVFVNNVRIDPNSRCYTDATIEIDNGGSGVYCVGGAGASGIRYDAISVGGNLSSLVDATDITSIRREKTLSDNETEFSLGIVLEDQNNNKLVIHRPNCQYTSLTQPESANGALVTNNGTISANGKGTAGYTVQVDYIAAP